MLFLDNDPLYLAFAASDIGLKEIPGDTDEPRIVSMLTALAKWLNKESFPWCGAALAKWMRQAGFTPPLLAYRAKSWLSWGYPTENPCRGDVVVFTRNGGGHVGILVGKTDNGRLAVLGGNQGDCVCISAFPRDRVSGYRMATADRPFVALPVVQADGSISET